MKMRLRLASILLFLALTIVSGLQADDIKVGESKMPPLKWGRQTVTYELTNETDYLKFVAVKIDLAFSGSYLNPQRSTISFAYLMPEETRSVVTPFYVPGNYGKASVKVELYDVVDTLDAITPNMKFFEQPFILTYKIPEELHSYFDEKINLPPRVEQHPAFDNEFSRILLLMLGEGKPLDEIIALQDVDSALVYDLLNEYVANGYVKVKDGVYELTFPVIKLDEAEETRKLALAVADSLVAGLDKNLPAYFETLNSLAEEGLMSADSNEFYDGGSALYRLYPSLGAFYLWYDLGRRFITRSAPLLLYDNTDPCNAMIPFYMYAVQGGDVFNGSHFYAPYFGPNSYQLVFADSVPALDCSGWNRPQRRFNNWAQLLHFEDHDPEVFVIDTNLVSQATKVLDEGTDSILVYAYGQLFKIADKYGHFKVLFGHRYWFWNLVATRTLEKLVDKGVCSRRGYGVYRFDGIPSKELLQK